MPRTPLPEPLREQIFSVATGRRHGVARGRMRGADLSSPFHGVRAPAQFEQHVRQRAIAYSARMPHSAFFSHTTAALLWGIPLPRHLERPDRMLDVGVPTGRAVPYGAGVTGHHLQLDGSDVATANGLRLTSPARTWCDLASVLSLHDLIAAGDSLLWWRRRDISRVSPQQLDNAIAAFRGRRGRPALIAARARLTDRSDSRAESIIRCRIVDAGLPKPSVNLELYDAVGNFLAMPDLSWERYRVCSDYEGDHHRTDHDQWEKDIARVPRLENAGWKNLRAGSADLRDSTQYIENLETRLRAGGWVPSPRRK